MVRFECMTCIHMADTDMHVQAHGASLSVGNVVAIAITATLAAIGSASIPNSALVSLITVLQVNFLYLFLTVLI